jgi:hypothetical protein
LKFVVVDASVALAWCFPDEASNYADGVLAAISHVKQQNFSSGSASSK